MYLCSREGFCFLGFFFLFNLLEQRQYGFMALTSAQRTYFEFIACYGRWNVTKIVSTALWKLMVFDYFVHRCFCMI